MTPLLPVLRAPPFPGIAAKVAQVSMMRDRPGPDRPETAEAAMALVCAIRAARVGGPFWAPPPPVVARPALLLRPCDAADARLMADEALRETAAEHVLMLLPATGWGRAAARATARRGIATTLGDVDPWPLLTDDNRLLLHGGDEWLLLAQIAGVRASVRSPGRFAPPAPRVPATVADRVWIDVVLHTAYRDPFTGAPADPVATIALLGEWRRITEANRGIAVATGMARWKRREVERFLWTGRVHPLRFVGTAAAAVQAAQRAGGAIAVWSSRRPNGLDAGADAAGVGVRLVEDGFIRSVGLGAACVPPLSITIDATGIHYDPARPSDLETLLARTDFPPALLDRADRLVRYIVAHGISKYAGGRSPEPPLRCQDGRRRVLVAGQVEDDLSVRLGGGGVAGNLDLLARARAAEPDAELWYRPHPDVSAGLRRGAIDAQDALRYADRIVTEGSMATLFDQIDAIHVLTSLAGFEALLRGLEVVVHGAPFYAGWGLTRDLGPPLPRRGRRLTLLQLVSGALLVYPRYLHPKTGLPCRVEQMAESLVDQPVARQSVLTRMQRIRGRTRWPAAKKVTG